VKETYFTLCWEGHWEYAVLLPGLGATNSAREWWPYDDSGENKARIYTFHRSPAGLDNLDYCANHKNRKRRVSVTGK
jgi:hypothetical protein